MPNLGGISFGSDLGKRKNRWEDDSGGSVMSAGPGCKRISSIASFPSLNVHHNFSKFDSCTFSLKWEP